MEPHRFRWIVFLWNNYAIWLRRTIDRRDETAHGASAPLRPWLPTCGESINAFPRPLQSKLHKPAASVIGHRTEVERPDDAFHKNLRVGPSVHRHVQCLA